jgi:hypothetical protein
MLPVLRRLLGLLTVLSLLIAAGTAWLHVRQVRFEGPELDLFSLYANGLHARYTLRADRRGVGLYGPPARVTPRRRARMMALVRATRIGWRIVRNEEPPVRYHANADYFPDWQPLKDEAKAAPTGEAVAVLLEALEEPDLFVTADDVLGYQYPLPDLPEGWGFYVTPAPDGTFVYHQNWLRVDFADLRESGQGLNSGGEAITVFSARARVDPAQFPAARARWHRHLDVPVTSASYAAVIGAASALPGLWCLAWWGRRGPRRPPARANRGPAGG